MVPRTYNGERTVSSINGISKTGYPYAKNEIRHFISQHIQKSTNKINYLNIKTWNCKFTKRKHRVNLLDIGLGRFFGYDPKSIDYKSIKQKKWANGIASS
jgi:methionine salvage enolase-phosphatase E1